MTDIATDKILSQLKPEAAERLRKLLDDGKMVLETVTYDPTTPKEVKQAIEREFNLIGQPAFLKYLAATHKDQLQGIGIGEHGLSCMKIGLLPHDEEGRPYPVNIDHISDRAGAGDHTDDVNSFDNLVLIHLPIHSLKTAFTHAQTRKIDEPTPILTLTPPGEPEQRSKILVPDNLVLKGEELGRPVWLYRATAASERYKNAAQLLADAKDPVAVKELELEAEHAHAAEEKIWEWALKAHREKDPQGFQALLQNDASVQADKETRNFFDKWLLHSPGIKADLGKGELKSSLILTAKEYEQLKEVTGFALMNYGIYDAVALDVSQAKILQIHEKLKTLTADPQIVTFTPGELANLVQLLGQTGQYSRGIPPEILSVDRDGLEALEDKLYAAIPMRSAAVPSPAYITMRLG